jgi:hypothetical protein
MEIIDVPEHGPSPLRGKVPVGAVLHSFDGLDTSLWSIHDLRTALIASSDKSRTLVWLCDPKNLIDDDQPTPIDEPVPVRSVLEYMTSKISSPETENMRRSVPTAATDEPSGTMTDAPTSTQSKPPKPPRDFNDSPKFRKKGDRTSSPQNKQQQDDQFDITSGSPTTESRASTPKSSKRKGRTSTTPPPIPPIAPASPSSELLIDSSVNHDLRLDSDLRRTAENNSRGQPNGVNRKNFPKALTMTAVRKLSTHIQFSCD